MRLNRKWLAGAVILFAYFLSYQGSEGTKFLLGVTPALKHATNFLLLLIVAIAGYYGLKGATENWHRPVWVFFYAVVIAIIAIFGIYDLFFPFANQSFRSMMGFLRLFFTSPVPYGIMFFLGQRLPRG